MQSYLLFVLITLAVVAHSAPRDQTPEEWARQQNDQRFNQEAYHGLPWEEYSKQSFFPREQQHRFRLADSDRQNAFLPTLASDDRAPTKTVPISLMRRAFENGCGPKNCFTFLCPTSVQCLDGGCCPLGDYCAIKGGILGCCSLTAPPCDTDPIPGCSVSCYGICCDLVQGIIGEPICSSTVGDGGQPSGICTDPPPPASGSLPTNSGCPGNELVCGVECCPSGAGLVCDNTTIPNQPFCNIPP
ncbi:hypothetical protein B0T10DRAFT_260255 [Thelonectria olida]|uniref:Uncharacterized protein n=1 Tax=Thelonectria olida TaxID=1576542 RepID=A0A9P8VQX5_9HYPO|nr:hypothetical protein B0T10DRAFT_260255 [Thelonectria olida]